MQAIVHQCFRAVAASTTDTISDVQVKTDISFVKEIRQLLPANDPNALYVFICCLSSVDPKLWLVYRRNTLQSSKNGKSNGL